MKQHAKKLLQTALILITSCYTVNCLAASSVWQVSKGDASLYIAATIDALPEYEETLPAEFDYAYQHADTLVLEANVPATTDSRAQLALLKALSYPQGETLSSKLSEEVAHALKEKLAEFNINLTELDPFRPFMINLVMTSVALQKHHVMGEDVSQYFAKRARANGKPTAYLETAEFQLQLFKLLGEGAEDAFITASLKKVNNASIYYEQLLSAWRSGNINRLAELTVQPLKQDDPATYQRLLVARNHSWLVKIESYFNSSEKELVMVDSAHLVGQDSLLTQLKHRGYQITQLNEGLL